MKPIKVDSKEYGIEENKAKQIAEQFKPLLDVMVNLEKEANKIFKLNPEDEETSKKAKELRLQYVKVRTGTAQIHKEQKAFYLAAGRYVDGWKNAQMFASQGIEQRLQEIENYAEIKEKERRLKLQEDRATELRKYLRIEDITPSHLGDLDDTTWAIYLTGAKQNHKDRIEAERLAEEKRKEDERKAALYSERKNDLIPFWEFLKEDIRSCDFGELPEESFRIILEEAREEKKKEEERKVRIEQENERLKKEAEEREKIRKIAEEKRKEQEEKERKEAEEKLRIERKQKEEAERKLRELEEAEAERKRQEEFKLQEELKKGDSDKMDSLISDLEALKTKYSFRSKNNKAKLHSLSLEINRWVELLKD